MVNTPAPKSETTVINRAPAKDEKQTPKERLTALKDLLEQDLITQADYDKKRASILADL